MGTAADAVFSPCGRYRYLLTRSWVPGRRAVGFVMLNPSRADHTLDDRTVRAAWGSRAVGVRGVAGANLFALRATDPTALLDTVAAGGDPVGSDNRLHLARWRPRTPWSWRGARTQMGSSAMPIRARSSTRWRPRAAPSSGRCADGSPRHPLYLPGDARLTPWTAAT